MPKCGWVDVLKGIGILLVVIGHILSGLAWNLIFLFHMPLFFFLSGYLFQPRQPRKVYLRKKILNLILPYMTFLTILYSPELMRLALSNEVSVAGLSETLYPMVVGGRELKGWTAVFWFVTCLFFVQQVSNLIMTSCSRRLTPLIFVAMLMASYAWSSFWKGFGLPWNVDVVLAAAPLFYVGHLFAKNGMHWRLVLFAGLVSLLALTGLYHGFPLSYDMKYGYYGIPVATFISAISLIIILAALSKAIDRVPMVAVPLRFIGSASLVIMFLHQPIQLTMRDEMGIESGLLRFCASTGISLFAYFLITNYSVTRALFLGSEGDVEILQRNRQERRQKSANSH